MTFAEQIETNYDKLLGINEMLNNINSKIGYREKIYLNIFIDTICDIPIAGHISISKRSMLLNITADFTIETEEICLYCNTIKSFNTDYDEVNITDIITGLLKVNKMIKNLKFNKQLGRFVDKFNKSDNAFASYFKNNKNIKLKIETCCVCLEPTKTKTGCGHHICIPCWSKIDKSSCPICRQNTNGEEFSEDE